MKLQVPTEIQFFSGFRLQNFLTGGGRVLFSHQTVLLASRELENLFQAAEELLVAWLHLIFLGGFFAVVTRLTPNKALELWFFPSDPPTQLAALGPRLLQWLGLCCPVPALLLRLPGPLSAPWVPSASPVSNLGSPAAISAGQGKAGMHP